MALDLKTIGEDEEGSMEASRDADQLTGEGVEDEVRPGTIQDKIPVDTGYGFG